MVVSFSVIVASEGFGLCDFQIKLITFPKVFGKFLVGLRFCQKVSWVVFVCDFPCKNVKIFSCESRICGLCDVGFRHFGCDFERELGFSVIQSCDFPATCSKIWWFFGM